MIKERFLWMLGGAIITIVVFILAQQFVFGSSSAEQITKDEAEKIVKSNFSGEVDEVSDNGENYSVNVKVQSRVYRVIVDKESGELLDVEFVKEIKKEDNDENQKDDSADSDNPPEQDEDKKGKNESNGGDQSKGEDQSNTAQQPNNDSDDTEPSLLTKKQVIEKVSSEIKGQVKSVKLVEEDSPYYKLSIENELEIINLDVDAATGEILAKKVEKKEKKTPVNEEEAINIALDEIGGKIDKVNFKEINGTLYYFIELEVTDEQEATIRINALNGNVTTIWGSEVENEDEKENEDEND